MGATQEQWLRGGSNGDDRLSEEGPDTDGTKHFIYISSLNRPDLPIAQVQACLLYTSDAADDWLVV